MNRLIDRFRLLLGHLKTRHARKVVAGIVGGSVVLVGIALLVLPGPAFLVIPLGLAILATEFLWARRWLKQARELISKIGGPAQPAAAPAEEGLSKPALTSQAVLHPKGHGQAP